MSFVVRAGALDGRSRELEDAGVMEWDLVASISGVVASVAGLSTDLCEAVAGLRVNMSLMLLRLSRSNSGRSRPEAGSMNLLEYSC